MENSDIDMVISIPDTPDRPVVRRASANKRHRSPEAPGRFQRGEHRHYPNGRATRPPASEAPENNGQHHRSRHPSGSNALFRRAVVEAASDTQTENGHHRSRASGSNALFRRTAVDKDKGKSICIDPSPARVVTEHVRTRNNGSSPNKGKGIVVDCGSVSNRETINLSSERKPVRSTRRLVRNGCISPHGIAARARQGVVDVTNNSRDTVSVEQELALEAASSIDIREIVSDDHVRGRARGKRPEIPPSRVASRDDALEGWVSTRSRSLNINHERDRRRDESDARGASSFVSGLDVLETGAVDREARPQRRRKNGLNPSRFEPQVSVIGSSGEPSSSSRTHNYRRQGRQVLEIEDSSPEARFSRAPRRVENDESDDVKARQIEADALMARELQEQMYAESTLRTEQMDETIARLMEQEENSLRPSSSRASTRSTRSSNTVAADPGGSSRVEERPQQHSSRRRMNHPHTRRATYRAPPRVRGRQLGRAGLQGAMNFNFPSGMGLDSRIDFLENLENVFGHSFNNSNLLHMDRDFTEDDYELLLALDDNNHQHGGASTSRINNLPESTVQTDNFQETCVICLETPTIGDTIRHLPCFHKFHKDCIDPWLGRSKSCPVCKSSVT